MVIAFPPYTLLEWLHFKQPAMLLGKKENAPTEWRFLSSLGKRHEKFEQKDREKFLRIVRRRKPDLAVFLDGLEHPQDGLPWKSAMHSLNMGLQRGGTPPLLTLEAEATRLERLASPIIEAVERVDFQAAFDKIASAGMPHIPCLHGIMGQIDCRGSKDRFAQTAAPVVIVTTLYLLACAEADWFDVGEPLGERLLPKIVDKTPVRPMRRWLEAVRESFGLKSRESLALFLLPGQEERTSRRELAGWWSDGKIPAWSRAPTMARAMARATRRKDVDTLEKMIRTGLAAVRLLDELLVLSVAIRNRHLPNYDPWSPFRDYPVMVAHARKVKAGLFA